jgi:hypothetical protein
MDTQTALTFINIWTGELFYAIFDTFYFTAFNLLTPFVKNKKITRKVENQKLSNIPNYEGPRPLGPYKKN